MMLDPKPLIHIWTYNHPYYGIVDQIHFCLSAFSQNGYNITYGHYPRKNRLNVVIENFSAYTSKKLIEFCKSTKKRVVIIMTEHLDFDLSENKIRMHGSLLNVENDYMPTSVQRSRIHYFMDCLPYIHGIFVLGDLPELRNFDKILPGVMVETLAFPKLDFIKNTNTHQKMLKNDLLFTGNSTEYRKNILEILDQKKLQVKYPQKFVSQKKRDQLIKSSRIILNIPQRKDWHWLSLMRILASLRLGRGVISLGTQDTSKISSCCLQLDPYSDETVEQLRLRIGHWYSFYIDTYEAYILMMDEFRKNFAFPHKMIECWSTIDRL